MKIAVIGSGNIGGTLGRKWARAGHAVTFGARNLDKPDLKALLTEAGPNARADTVAGAIAGAEVIVLALPGKAVAALLADQGRAMAGKIIIDATNKWSSVPMNSVQEITGQAAGAHVYRAFNSLGWENFANPNFGDEQADLFYAGAEGPATGTVEGLIRDIGMRPIRVGDLDQAALVDNIGTLWSALAFGRGMGRHLAFKVLT